MVGYNTNGDCAAMGTKYQLGCSVVADMGCGVPVLIFLIGYNFRAGHMLSPDCVE